MIFGIFGKSYQLDFIKHLLIIIYCLSTLYSFSQKNKKDLYDD